MGVLRRVALIVLGVLASTSLVASCGGDTSADDDAATTARGDLASPQVQRRATPTALSSATGALVPSTGDATLDAIAIAALNGEVDELMGRVSYERMACVTTGQYGSPIMCPGGIREGTVLDAFFYAHCDGAWIGRDALRAAFERTLSVPLTLYAVLEPEPGGVHLIVFVDSSMPFEGFWLIVREDRIVGRGGPCVPLPQSDIFVDPVAVLVQPIGER